MRRIAVLVAVFGLLTGLVFWFMPQATSAVSSGVFYSLTYDGTLSNHADTYATTHTNTDTDNVVVEYTGTVLHVGRTKISSTFYEYRPVLFFDTSEVPAGAQIASAFVTLHGAGNHSTTDFDITLVSPGDIHSPMVVTDYATMLPHTTALNQTFNTTSYATEMILNLNSTGITAIIHEGITVMGVRSSLDIAGTPDPTGDEYVDFYSSESARPPTLTVVYYSTGILGTPDTMNMASVIVFSGYRESGDQLWLLRSNVEYQKGAENLDSKEYWSIEITDNSSTLMASTPLWSWGYVPASIYLSAANALPWGSYTVTVTGNADKYPSGVPYVSHSMLDSDYKGTDNSTLDQWCMSTAIDIGRVEQDDINYYRTQISGKWVINDAGQILFSSGIPLIESVRPNLFLSPIPEGGQEHSGSSYADLLWPNWGTSLIGDWALIAAISGMPSQLVASVCFFGLIFAIVFIVDKETGKPLLGMIPGSLGLIAGTLLGSPNLVVLLSILGLAVIYFYYETIPTRT